MFVDRQVLNRVQSDDLVARLRIAGFAIQPTSYSRRSYDIAVVEGKESTRIGQIHQRTDLVMVEISDAHPQWKSAYALLEDVRKR